MKYLALLLLSISFSAFAYDKITLDANFNVSECRTVTDGEECETSVIISPTEGQQEIPKITIPLGYTETGVKRGEYTIVQATNEGEFEVTIHVSKFSDRFEIYTEFTDPDGFSSTGPVVTFTKLIRLDYEAEGLMWGLENGKYLLPSISIKP